MTHLNKKFGREAYVLQFITRLIIEHSSRDPDRDCAQSLQTIKPTPPQETTYANGMQTIREARNSGFDTLIHRLGRCGA